MDGTKKYRKVFFALLTVFSTAFILSGCSNKNEWTGFYYSDIDRMSDESTWKIQPGLKSLEACRKWIDGVHRYGDNYDYECGYNCRYETDIQLTVCEETKE